MKYLKLFENFGNDKLFYHLSSKKHLKNLLEGTKPITNNRHSKTQGGGFYLWNSEEDAYSWKGGKESDVLLEYKIPFNIDNFELDFISIPG